MTLQKYKEYKDTTGRFTLEVFIYEPFTLVKLFNRDQEEVRLEYNTESPVVKGVINSLIALMNNELYQHN
jgi:hypothetical protein